MDLGDGGGGQRHVFDPLEDLRDRLAQLLVEHRLHLGPGRRGRVALQPAQLVDEVGRQEVAPGGEHLTELDEHAAAFLQGQPGRPRALLAVRPGLHGAVPAAPSAQHAAQSVPYEDPADLGVAVRPAQPVAEAPHRLQRSGPAAVGDEDLKEHQRGHRDEQRQRDLHGGEGAEILRAVVRHLPVHGDGCHPGQSGAEGAQRADLDAQQAAGGHGDAEGDRAEQDRGRQGDQQGEGNAVDDAVGQ
ncbi:hypothetical protein [Streptomyces sp. NPDC046887]|uniref:hypothetical protein n=1 Tax=Streptomyces sp. NPDC046887 TaxID=3155472 RepID=UPI0033FE7374